MAVPLTLKVYKGDELVSSRDYDRDIIKIGRLASAHLCLDDEKVSRIHSVIEVGGDGTLSIIDMGSVEGTYVNGKRVNKGALAFGDEIKVGDTMIRVSQFAANLAQAAASVSPEASMNASNGAAPVANMLAHAAGATALSSAPAVEQLARSVSGGWALDRDVVQKDLRASLESTQIQANPFVRTSPAPERAFGPLGLKLRFMWGDRLMGEYLLPPNKESVFTVGSAQGVQFAMNDEKLLSPKFELVRAGTHGFELRFTSKMAGELIRRQQTFELKEKAQQDGGAYSLALQSDDSAWVDLGNIRLEVCFRSVPTPVVVPFSQTLDLATLNTFLVLFFLGALFVISAANRQLEGDEYADELNSNQARIAKLILKPPEIQKNPFLEQLAHQKQQAEMAAKHSGDEGQMGRKDVKKKTGRTTPKGIPSDKDIARNMTQKIFGGKGGISSIIGNGHGGALEAALGNLTGPTAGNAQGLGGLGIKGQAAGGGGIGKTLGIGAVGTKGRGGGNGAYGMGAGNIGGKTSIDPSITSSEPEVMGSLDKELIRRVIHANRNQIRYCYESQLQQHPKLAGRVSVKFVITPSGAVATSDVVQDTTSNRELETCVAGRVHTWIFPKPKGGGVVMVTYPFIFKQAGQ